MPTAADYETVYDAIVTNADYDAGSGDTSKCELFIAACRKYLLFGRRGSHAGTEEFELNSREIQAESDKAYRWLANQNAATLSGSDVAGGAVYFDLSEYRE